MKTGGAEQVFVVHFKRSVQVKTGVHLAPDLFFSRISGFLDLFQNHTIN